MPDTFDAFLQQNAQPIASAPAAPAKGDSFDQFLAANATPIPGVPGPPIAPGLQTAPVTPPKPKTSILQDLFGPAPFSTGNVVPPTADVEARNKAFADSMNTSVENNPALKYLANTAGESQDIPGLMKTDALGAGFEGAAAAQQVFKDTPAVLKTLTAARAGIGAWFTAQGIQGATGEAGAAKQSYDKGDYSAMMQHLGIAGVNSLFAFLAGQETVKNTLPGFGPIMEQAQEARAAAEASKPFSERDPRSRGPAPPVEVLPPQAGLSPEPKATPTPEPTPAAGAPASAPAAEPAAPLRPQPEPAPSPATPRPATEPPPAPPEQAPEATDAEVDRALSTEPPPVGKRDYPDVQIPPEYLGKTVQVKTAAGYKALVQYAMVPTEWVNGSHDNLGNPNPRFLENDPDNQPRDRSTAASLAQMADMRANFDPDQKMDSTNASDGASIVTPNLFRLSGNGGGAVIQGMYNDEHPNAQFYKQQIEAAKSKFGITGDFQPGDKPELVRILRSLPDGVSNSQFALDTNEPSVAAMSSPEQAKVDSRQLSPDLLSKFVPNDEGRIATPDNRDFIRSFADQVVGKSKRNEFMTDDGTLSQSGEQRIRNAVFHAAYQDTGTLSKLSEDLDPNIKNTMNGMLRAAPHFALQRQQIAAGNLYPRDLSGDVAAAAKKLSALRDAKTTIADYQAQQGLFGNDLSPIQHDILSLMGATARSPNKLGEVLQQYTHLVELAGDPKQTSMFGSTEPFSKADLLTAAIERVAELHSKEKANGAKHEPAVQQDQPGVEPDRSERAPERGTTPAPRTGKAKAPAQRKRAGRDTDQSDTSGPRADVDLPKLLGTHKGRDFWLHGGEVYSNPAKKRGAITGKGIPKNAAPWGTLQSYRAFFPEAAEPVAEPAPPAAPRGWDSVETVTKSPVVHDIESLPPVAAKHTRLYRGEAAPGTGPGVPDWLNGNEKFEKVREAAGRWFTEDPEIAEWYVNESGEHGRLTYLDVPTAIVDKYRVSAQPSEVRRLSADPENEIFLPATYKGQAKVVPPIPRASDVAFPPDAQHTGEHDGEISQQDGSGPESARENVEANRDGRHNEDEARRSVETSDPDREAQVRDGQEGDGQQPQVRYSRDVDADLFGGAHDSSAQRAAETEAAQRLDAQRVTHEFGSKSTKRLDAGKAPIDESPLFGGPRQGDMFAATQTPYGPLQGGVFAEARTPLSDFELRHLYGDMNPAGDTDQRVFGDAKSADDMDRRIQDLDREIRKLDDALNEAVEDALERAASRGDKAIKTLEDLSEALERAAAKGDEAKIQSLEEKLTQAARAVFGHEAEVKNIADLHDAMNRAAARGDKAEVLALGDKLRRAMLDLLGPSEAKPWERGSANLEFVSAGLSKLLVEEGPRGNYSELGATKDKFVRNLSQLEEANPRAHADALKAAGSRGATAVLLRAAVPRIEAALGKNVSWDEMRAALAESRLRGIRDRWNDLAEHALRAGEKGLQSDFEHGLMTLLDNIAGKRDIPQDVAQTALALYQRSGIADLRNKENADLFPEATAAEREARAPAIADLRNFLAETFRDAAAGVERVLRPEDFDRITTSPGFAKGLATYKDLLEAPLAKNHEENEGIFSSALGPLGTYYPLIPFGKEESAPPGRRVAYRKPRNIANEFATGLSPMGFDTGMTPLAERINRAVRGNNKAALLTTLQQEGLLRPILPADKSQTMTWRGQEYAAARIETKPDRMIVTNGKLVHRPAQSALIPKWLKSELAPLLEEGADGMPPGKAEKLLSAINGFSLAGPLDLVFHARNLLGTMTANTPFAGTDILSKTIGNTPVTKLFTSIIHIVNTDPASDDAIRDMNEMARLGLIPDRYGSETFSKKFADQTGAHRPMLDIGPLSIPKNLGPLLYGPRGLDIRARLQMYRIAKEINPQATPQEMYKFVTQLGGYVRDLESRLERWAKDTGVAPFATAGTTMLRNGINSVLGTSPLPTSGMGMPHQLKYWFWTRLSGGVVGLAALWVLAHRAMTGKWPWDDEKARMLQLPVPDTFRRSKLGNALWGNKGGTGYVHMSVFSPIVERGMRALGISGAFDAGRKRGTAGQMIEAGEKDAMNSFANPFTTGPVVRAASVMALGADPHITSLRDHEGHYSPQLMPAVGPSGAGLASLRDRAIAAALSMNSFAGKVAAMTGFGQKPGENDGSNGLLRMITDLTMPGFVSYAQNPAKQIHAMQLQRREIEHAERKAKRKAS